LAQRADAIARVGSIGAVFYNPSSPTCLRCSVFFLLGEYSLFGVTDITAQFVRDNGYI
jgi:hypothetical protein